ncbi:MAG TPA: hypothetical protein VF613_08125 [Longimicrobium sp.]|jgi:hypothetical protein
MPPILQQAPAAPTPRRSLGAYRPVQLRDLVRLGRDNDGGYVVSERVCAATRTILALGISTDWSFESAFHARNPAVRVIGVDGSVSAQVFRRGAKARLAAALRALSRLRYREMRFEIAECRELLRLARGLEDFFGQNGRFCERFITASESPRSITWQSLIAEIPAEVRDVGGVFVKMDIEGAEYEVLPEVLRDASSLSGMVIEFHDCDLHWDAFADLMDRAMTDFVVVHVHGNNWRPLIPGTAVPSTLEVTLLHRRLIGEEPASQASYPLAGLDQPCHPDRPDYTLSFDQRQPHTETQRGAFRSA